MRYINLRFTYLLTYPYHSPRLHPRPCSSVGMRRGTDRQRERHKDRDTVGHDQYTFSPMLRLTRNVMRNDRDSCKLGRSMGRFYAELSLHISLRVVVVMSQ